MASAPPAYHAAYPPQYPQYPPPMGFAAPPQAPSTVVNINSPPPAPPPVQQTVIMQAAAPQPQTIVVTAQSGNCPKCHAGVLVQRYTCCGIFLAIIFFPIGILCCCCMQEKRCTNCGKSY